MDYLQEGEKIEDLMRDELRIIQNPKGFCFGTDAVLLSHFTRVREGARVLDMCSGTGIIPILLTSISKAKHITAVEILEDYADMASRSVRMNGLEDKISVKCANILSLDKSFTRASFDTITCNPPYIPDGGGIKGEINNKLIARHEVLCTLEDVIRIASILLKSGGNLSLVHRPFRLAEIIELMSKYAIEPKRLRLVSPYANKEPSLILIEGKKDANKGIIIEPPLIIYESKDVYSQEMNEIYGFDRNEEKDGKYKQK